MSVVRCMAASCAVLVAALGCQPGSRLAWASSDEVAEGQGVRVARIPAGKMPLGAAVHGRAGDWLLEGRALSVVIGGDGAGASAELERGSVLDVSRDHFTHDGLERLSPTLFEGARELPLRSRRVEIVHSGATPFLRVVHESGDGRLQVTTEARLAPDQPYLELVSTVNNSTPGPLWLALGDRVRFLYAPPFAPGLGEITHSTQATSSWFGVDSKALSYALIFPGAPLSVTFRAQPQAHYEALARTSSRRVLPGASLAYRRLLLAQGPDRLALSEAAYALSGAVVGHVVTTLPDVPRWATIEARDPADRLVFKAPVPRTGKIRLPLPPGAYRLVLRTPGGTDHVRVVVSARAETLATLLVPAPRRLSYRVFDGDRLVPARLVLRGLPPTADPNLGPPHSSAGAGNVTYTGQGEASLELPAGRYSVLATHGPEYTIDERAIDLTGQKGATLRFSIHPAVNTKGWIACDFHLHADPSGDSEVPLSDRVVSLLAEGVEYAVATDHNVVTDYGPTVAGLDAGARLATASGVEITTSSWGHFNTYPYNAAEPPPYAGVTPAQIFEAVHRLASGALIQVNHPRMGELGYFNRANLDTTKGEPDAGGFSFAFDTLEVFNGFEHERATIERNLQDWFALLNLGRTYTAVGNSDSHRLVDHWAGYPRTYVSVANDSPSAVTSDEIKRALRRGRAIVSNGPFLELSANQAAIGDTTRAAQGGVPVRRAHGAAMGVSVREARLVMNGAVVRQITVPDRSPGTPLRFQYTTELAIERDSWLVAVASSDEPMERVLPNVRAIPFAFTNPIYIDGDGDGVMSPASSGRVSE